MKSREIQREIQKEYLKRNNNYLLRKIKGIPFLIPVYWNPKDKPLILRINKVGTEIWNLLVTKKKLQEVARFIVMKYHITHEHALNDALEFLSLLIESEAIEIKKKRQVPRTKTIGKKIDSEDFIYRIIEEEFKGASFPISLTWEVTHRCNLSCVHCYIVNSRKKEKQQELTLQEIDNLLPQLLNAGCLEIIITGGEPFLRKDIIEILSRFKQLGVLYSIYTNVTLVTEEVIDFLVAHPPILIEVSIYGMKEQTFETVTRKKGSYRKFKQGLERLVDKKFNLRLKSIAMKQNYQEIKLMKKFAKEIGADFRFDSLITPAIDGSCVPTQWRLNPKTIVDLEKKDKEVINKLKAYDRQRDLKEEFYKCGAGRYEANIDPCGRLSLCFLDRIPFYDLKRGSFEEGWKFISSLRKTAFPITSKCFGCRIRDFCKICPGWLKIERQLPNDKVEFICQVAKKRSEIFQSKTLKIRR